MFIGFVIWAMTDWKQEYIFFFTSKITQTVWVIYCADLLYIPEFAQISRVYIINCPFVLLTQVNPD